MPLATERDEDAAEDGLMTGGTDDRAGFGDGVAA
jgi:hypothetical protein